MAYPDPEFIRLGIEKSGTFASKSTDTDVTDVSQESDLNLNRSDSCFDLESNDEIGVDRSHCRLDLERDNEIGVDRAVIRGYIFRENKDICQLQAIKDAAKDTEFCRHAMRRSRCGNKDNVLAKHNATCDLCSVMTRIKQLEVLDHAGFPSMFPSDMPPGRPALQRTYALAARSSPLLGTIGEALPVGSKANRNCSLLSVRKIESGVQRLTEAEFSSVRQSSKAIHFDVAHAGAGFGLIPSLNSRVCCSVDGPTSGLPPAGSEVLSYQSSTPTADSHMVHEHGVSETDSMKFQETVGFEVSEAYKNTGDNLAVSEKRLSNTKQWSDNAEAASPRSLSGTLHVTDLVKYIDTTRVSKATPEEISFQTAYDCSSSPTASISDAAIPRDVPTLSLSFDVRSDSYHRPESTSPQTDSPRDSPAANPSEAGMPVGRAYPYTRSGPDNSRDSQGYQVQLGASFPSDSSYYLSGTTQHGLSRQRGLAGRDSDDDLSDGEQASGHTETVRARLQQLLDCPVRKHNPALNNCGHNGFPKASRVREHLMRNHNKHEGCPNCGKKHKDPERQCRRGQHVQKERFDLRSLPDTIYRDTDENKWFSFWRHLFPGESTEGIDCWFDATLRAKLVPQSQQGQLARAPNPVVRVTRAMPDLDGDIIPSAQHSFGTRTTPSSPSSWSATGDPIYTISSHSAHSVHSAHSALSRATSLSEEVPRIETGDRNRLPIYGHSELQRVNAPLQREFGIRSHADLRKSLDRELYALFDIIQRLDQLRRSLPDAGATLQPVIQDLNNGYIRFVRTVAQPEDASGIPRQSQGLYSQQQNQIQENQQLQQFQLLPNQQQQEPLQQWQGLVHHETDYQYQYEQQYPSSDILELYSGYFPQQ